MASQSLIEILLSLFKDEQQLAAFQADPEGFLANCGVTDVTPDDVHETLVLLQDSHDASFDRDYNTGSHHHPHVPPPPHPKPGEDPHEVAVKYLNTYVTNNYVDDRDTIVDNSINQNIDNRGGVFNQDIDVDSVVASGDGAVAAGGDIEDSNVVTGDNNTVANDGDATSVGDINASNGSAVTLDGNATGNYADNDTNTNVENFGDGDTAVNAAGAAGTANQAADQSESTTTTTTTTTNTTGSYNQDNDVVEDSFNPETEIDIASNNDLASHNSDDDVTDDKDFIDA